VKKESCTNDLIYWHRPYERNRPAEKQFWHAIESVETRERMVRAKTHPTPKKNQPGRPRRQTHPGGVGKWKNWGEPEKNDCRTQHQEGTFHRVSIKKNEKKGGPFGSIIETKRKHWKTPDNQVSASKVRGGGERRAGWVLKSRTPLSYARLQDRDGAKVLNGRMATPRIGATSCKLGQKRNRESREEMLSKNFSTVQRGGNGACEGNLAKPSRFGARGSRWPKFSRKSWY